MFLIVILILVCANIFQVKAQDPCLPLWPRLEFGGVFADDLSSEKLVLKFNTKSACMKSFAVITDSKGTIRKTYCESSKITGSQKMASYQTFVQRCSIESIQFEQKINYIPYGSNQTTGTAIPFGEKSIEASIMNPNTNRTLKLVFLADWSELHAKVGIYKSLNQSLDKIRLQQNIDGLILNGDLAYDLDSNNGTNYQEILNLISRVSKFVPVFFIAGNHQHNSPDDLLLLYKTFEQYGLDSKLAAGLNLGPFFMIAFDPNDILYQNSNSKNLRVNAASLQGFAESIEKGKKTNKTLLAISHYPLKCSAKAKNCQNDTTYLKDYFNLMFQNNIKFYIGAHYHTYERIYPYCQNGSFSLTPSPYNLQGQKCIVSLIEGIAGNDDKIVQTYDNVQNYTAKLSFNKTGLGLLQVDINRMKYQHYSSVNVLTLQDEFQITFGSKFQLQLQSE